MKKAKDLVAVGDEIAAELGIPIVNKRVSVTPISIIGAATNATDYVPFAKALDRAAKEVGVNFIGGFSALVQKRLPKKEMKSSSILFLELLQRPILSALQSISVQPSLVLI